MSTPKRSRVPKRRHGLFSQLGQAPKQCMAWLLRLIFISARFTRANQAGFVLPTTVLLLLVVSLTVGSLSYRAFSRSASVIAEREQQVVYGAATPAIDRAKAKLEYLFDKKVPSNNTPRSSTLEDDLLDDAIFSLPDETRVNINVTDDNGDTRLDNAWWFPADVNGDGNLDDADGDGKSDEGIVYSILVGHEGSPPGSSESINIEDIVSQNKARALVARNGPIDVSSSSANCPVSLGTNEEGWQELSTTSPILKKNFQIDAFTVNSSDTNRTVSALEVQQVRESRKGSKWGAWFKNDLEIFPGAGTAFTWNGAMHTEGSLFLGPTVSDLNLRMISSYNSCLYSETASEIELVENRAPNDYDGQVIAGNLTGGEPGFGGNKTKLDWYKGQGVKEVGTKEIGTADDSINTQPSNIEDLALDPIKLFTADELDFRVPASLSAQSDADFWDKDYAKNRITRTDEDDPPFLDDIYRADGRFGPKAVYASKKKLSLSQAKAKLGDPIAGVTTGTGADDFTTTQRDELDNSSEPFEGLDGYWEKQATDKGAKVIVGERLQLGNPFGWKGAYASKQNPNDDAGVEDVEFEPRNMDSLYPAYNGDKNKNNNTLNGSKDQSLRLHTRSLNDNLAAVQSMAVYHYKSASKTFPRACMSLVSHPGTNTTQRNARTFNQLPKINSGSLSLTAGTDLVNVDFGSDGTNDIDIDADFFFGYGTNAWEYEPPLKQESAFKAAYDANTLTPLKKALTNLAFFAGDPAGGSPSFTPVQGQQGGTDPFIHPYPYLSMWGDYSPLRRILEPKANGGLGDPDYDDLSIADKTTVQTAACTLGMLATNIQVADSLDYTDGNVQAALTALASEVGSIPSGVAPTGKDYVPQAYIAAFERDANRPALGLARLLHLKEQIKRDRENGFEKFTFTYRVEYAPSAGHEILPGQDTIVDGDVFLSFDPEKGDPDASVTADDYFGVPVTDEASELRFLRLAAIAGGIQESTLSPPPELEVGLPKFPALYYLFPEKQHDYLGNHPTNTALNSAQPNNEPYIDPDLDGNPATNSYTAISNRLNPTAAALYTYEPVTLDDIRAEPRGDIANWTLPYTTTITTDRPNTITRNGTDLAAILFQDKSFMDGREMLSVRTVEIDVDMATDDDTDVKNRQVDGQSWFTEGEAATATKTAVQGGIFYAFREDARREDEILRPIDSSFTDASNGWEKCDSTTEILEEDCRMDFDIGSEQDPPIRFFKDSKDADKNNYISTKPVDFYPDPERRPHGFRLANGKTLNRDDDVSTGLTFVTDNALYIQGDFNLHTARDSAGTVSPGDSLEEFYTFVDGDGNGAIAKDEFYEDRGKTAPDFNTELFARPDGDDWRPVELVADATSILSMAFKDGVVSDYFLKERGNVSDPPVPSGSSSYQNMFRLKTPGAYEWTDTAGDKFRYPGLDDTNKPSLDRVFQSKYAATTTNATPDSDPIWPFWIRRLGKVDGAINVSVAVKGETKVRATDRIPAQDTRVNALLISGIIPSRKNISYGGLHNFPRLNEDWSGKNLFISGAFYQLNFSTASTGLFEQDIKDNQGAWEPGGPTVKGSGTQYYYGAPGRKWGYDVAFQYVTPGPVSQRFTTNEKLRSEYYKDLPADDPYVINLQCAKDENGKLVVKNRTVTCE